MSNIDQIAEDRIAAVLLVILPQGKKVRATIVDKLRHFWERADVTDGCWTWASTRNHEGYGVIRIASKMVRAHRVAYMLSVGSIPDGQVIRHSCDNPSCVNPLHLAPGTYKQNSEDMIARCRVNRKGTGKRRFGEANGSSKLTIDQVIDIRRRHLLTGIGAHRLGREFLVSKSTVQEILSGKTWGQVTQPSSEVS